MVHLSDLFSFFIVLPLSLCVMEHFAYRHKYSKNGGKRGSILFSLTYF